MPVSRIVNEQILSIRTSFNEPLARRGRLVREIQLVTFFRKLGESGVVSAKSSAEVSQLVSSERFDVPVQDALSMCVCESFSGLPTPGAAGVVAGLAVLHADLIAGWDPTAGEKRLAATRR